MFLTVRAWSTGRLAAAPPHSSEGLYMEVTGAPSYIPVSHTVVSLIVWPHLCAARALPPLTRRQGAADVT